MDGRVSRGRSTIIQSLPGALAWLVLLALPAYAADAAQPGVDNPPVTNAAVVRRIAPFPHSAPFALVTRNTRYSFQVRTEPMEQYEQVHVAVQGGTLVSPLNPETGCFTVRFDEVSADPGDVKLITAGIGTQAMTWKFLVHQIETAMPGAILLGTAVATTTTIRPRTGRFLYHLQIRTMSGGGEVFFDDGTQNKCVLGTTILNLVPATVSGAADNMRLGGEIVPLPP